MARFDEKPPIADWQPKTELGRRVKAGQITSMSQALRSGLALREAEIVDILLPGLEDDVIDVNMVQRMTDSGRRVRFRVTTVVGNRDGFVGLGQARGKEVGPTIRRAIDAAKLNVIEVRRGCGSWECGCKRPHTVPFEVTGKAGSAEITLRSSPQGVGIATGAVPRQVLSLAGVQDVWSFARGQTKTTINFAKATYNALALTSKMRVLPAAKERIGIKEGSVVQ